MIGFFESYELKLEGKALPDRVCQGPLAARGRTDYAGKNASIMNPGATS